MTRDSLSLPEPYIKAMPYIEDAAMNELCPTYHRMVLNTRHKMSRMEL